MPASETRSRFHLLSFAFAIAFITPNPAGATVFRWADTLESFARGADDLGVGPVPLASFGSPTAALGPQDGSVVSLGEQGSATLSFSLPLVRGPGDDFAVFENPFDVSPTFGGGTFAELAFVEVSSDGLSFARFESFYGTELVAGGFGQIVDPSLVTGLAGVIDVSSGGDPFDLDLLLADPLVIGGSVDLDAIRFVRVIDIWGDGSTLDSFGHAIFDPPGGFGSGGHDLDAIGALQPLPEPGGGLLFAVGLALAARRSRA